MRSIFVLETLAIERPCLRERLMQLYLTLDALTEVPCVLDQLKAVGLRTAILSNGTPTMLRAAVDGAIQTPHQGLSARRGPSVATGVGDRVPIVEFPGTPRGGGVRHARRVVQSLWPAAGAASRHTRREVTSLAKLPGLVGASARRLTTS